MSEEAKQKMIASKKWKKQSEEHKRKNREANSWEKWNKRQWWKIIYWKKQALKRDDYNCKKCWLREPEIMVVDHIKPKSIFPELSIDINNLQTLCPNCHARKTIKEKKQWYDRKNYLY